MCESPGYSGQGLARPLMFIHWLWKIPGNDGHFRTGVESDFHGADGHQWAVCGHTKGADMRRPTRVFSVDNPTTASRMSAVIGKAGLRECVRWRRDVDMLIMYFISYIVQCVRIRPVVG